MTQGEWADLCEGVALLVEGKEVCAVGGVICIGH